MQEVQHLRRFSVTVVPITLLQERDAVFQRIDERGIVPPFAEGPAHVSGHPDPDPLGPDRAVDHGNAKLHGRNTFSTGGWPLVLPSGPVPGRQHGFRARGI